MGIKCKIFNPAVPILSVRLNNRDHRKIIIIDGKTAFTGGFNLADEYIGQKESKTYYKDSVLKVDGPAVQNFLMMFLSSWNYLNSTDETMESYLKNCQDDITGKETSQTIYQNMKKGYIQPYSDTPLDQEGVNETVFLNLINRATDYIYITTPYLIIDNELITALCNAAKSGIDVRILTPKIPDRKPVHKITQSYYPTLLESKIKIYEYSLGFIHSKTVTVDDQYCIVGSVNFDYRSLYLNFECAVWMYQVECIKDVKKDFLETQNISDPIKYENCKKQNWIVKLLITILRIFAPLF